MYNRFLKNQSSMDNEGNQILISNGDYEQHSQQKYRHMYSEEDEALGGGGYELDGGGSRRADYIAPHSLDSSQGKLFVGGISWETTEESFGNYFSKYGEIMDSVIMIDKHTGKPRGFGFVTFAASEVADKVLEEDHVIDGRAVEVKRTVPRDNNKQVPRDSNLQPKGVSKTRKIFVGGLPLSLTEDELKEYFSSYGIVMEHQIMFDRHTGKSRGFGFVTFDSESVVEKIFLNGQIHELGGKQVEIKKAEPKRVMGGFGNDSGGRRGGNTKSYGGSGGFGRGAAGYKGGFYDNSGGGYGAYGSHGGYGGYDSYGRGSASLYGGGFGGYGYGFGFGFVGQMYGAAAYGGYGAAGNYGGGYVGGSGGSSSNTGGYGSGFNEGRNKYNGSSGDEYDHDISEGGGYDGSNGYGNDSTHQHGGEYDQDNSEGGGCDGSQGYGNDSTGGGRYHPYRN